LLEQKYIKDDKKSIAEVVKNVSKEINSSLSVDNFELVIVGK
jgi:translation elongation factor EF-Ts